MKKNNNNQILYLSLPLYGKFTFKARTSVCIWQQPDWMSFRRGFVVGHVALRCCLGTGRGPARTVLCNTC